MRGEVKREEVNTVMSLLRVLFIAISILIISEAWALEPAPLPDFTVSSLDGAMVSSTDLITSPGQDPLSGVATYPRWLLVYMPLDSGSASGSLVNVLESVSQSPSAGSIVVIAGGFSPKQVSNYLIENGKLLGIKWYSDAEKGVEPMLPLAGMPTVIGMNGNIMEWSLSGNPWDPTIMHSILLDWVGFQ